MPCDFDHTGCGSGYGSNGTDKALNKQTGIKDRLAERKLRCFVQQLQYHNNFISDVGIALPSFSRRNLESYYLLRIFTAANTCSPYTTEQASVPPTANANKFNYLCIIRV